ncbi:hypothetical protein PsorP6_003595 [Peronosclerospora sorghi]|uniref:Uncharacterized protein n=1 Tax=Peronosclerospora sorghi TaxID=230839 RepID=A0ACC0VRL2_9STRA|nr:hypothetical protein PsorP6_003595 [Peronosclerospora sorghi]
MLVFASATYKRTCRTLCIFVCLKKIQNIWQRAQYENLEGRMPMDTLLTVDDAGHASHLFFAYASSLKLALQQPQVLVVDATYKTNAMRLPLLHFVGCSSMYTAFSIGFSFMSNESEHPTRFLSANSLMFIILSTTQRFLWSTASDVLKNGGRRLAVMAWVQQKLHAGDLWLYPQDMGRPLEGTLCVNMDR